MLVPFTRPETIRVLNSLGVDVPADTKLLDDILEKRLCDALDAVQYKDRLPDAMDLKSLNPWPMVEHDEPAITSRPLVEAVMRHNLDEVRKMYAKLRAGEKLEKVAFVDPFDDLRQTIAITAKTLDDGGRWVVLQDEGMESAILIRFVAVLEVDENLPVLVVLYRAVDQATGVSGADWAILQSRTNPPNIGVGFLLTTATLLEQKMLLKILKRNESLVPADYQVTRRALEEHFKVSVLLPVGPLECDALAKLNNNMGCAVCGNRAASRCSSCQSVSYCSAVCQHADWSKHKPSCRSLKDATWRTIRVRAGYWGTENCEYTLLNKYTCVALPTGSREMRRIFYLDDALPHTNVYGDRPFLVKMQISPDGIVPGNIQIYDRRLTFLAFLREDVDPKAFWEFKEEMRGPRGGLLGMKMYRWAKRTGDWELSVCLDREPVTDTKW